MSKRFVKKLEQLVEATKKGEPVRAIKDPVALGKAAKQASVPELSAAWYDSKAHKFVHDYGHDIEDNWEEGAINQYCNNLLVTYGFEVDKDKLMKAIKRVMKDREDQFLEVQPVTFSLSELAQNLRREALNEHRIDRVISSASGINERMELDDSMLSYQDYATVCRRCDPALIDYLGDKHGSEVHSEWEWDELAHECERDLELR